MPREDPCSRLRNHVVVDGNGGCVPGVGRFAGPTPGFPYAIPLGLIDGAKALPIPTGLRNGAIVGGVAGVFAMIQLPPAGVVDCGALAA